MFQSPIRLVNEWEISYGPQGDGEQGSVGSAITRRSSSQLIKGFPVKPVGQLQIGEWLTTLQVALGAHGPEIHGSTHFIPMQALSSGHSEDVAHSGCKYKGHIRFLFANLMTL